MIQIGFLRDYREKRSFDHKWVFGKFQEPVCLENFQLSPLWNCGKILFSQKECFVKGPQIILARFWDTDFGLSYYPGQKNWDNRVHVAQARDLSSMHVPMFGLRACLNFLARVVPAFSTFMVRNLLSKI